MSPFRKMQLSVSAVMLILPALQSGASLSGAKLYEDCMDYLGDAGELKCGLEGLGMFIDYDPYSCTLRCQRPGTPKLPDGVCTPRVGVECTLGPRETLRNWIDELTRQKNRVLIEWCPNFPKK
ncbi:uncharacterized protein LOC120849361 [Ixodes scapularis]|uniref:uncharacterized protein LOC120849361 n=1 Tax=Ixodes scapularis TaxID=6945 RepID=UPI001A9CFB76|nr:uncharacterized protein LOC120849361 [Ixodes scapularis]